MQSFWHCLYQRGSHLYERTSFPVLSFLQGSTMVSLSPSCPSLPFDCLWRLTLFRPPLISCALASVIGFMQNRVDHLGILSSCATMNPGKIQGTASGTLFFCGFHGTLGTADFSFVFHPRGLAYQHKDMACIVTEALPRLILTIIWVCPSLSNAAAWELYFSFLCHLASPAGFLYGSSIPGTSTETASGWLQFST